jgi:hypothetical protein
VMGFEARGSKEVHASWNDGQGEVECIWLSNLGIESGKNQYICT